MHIEMNARIVATSLCLFVAACLPTLSHSQSARITFEIDISRLDLDERLAGGFAIHWLETGERIDLSDPDSDQIWTGGQNSLRTSHDNLARFSVSYLLGDQRVFEGLPLQRGHILDFQMATDSGEPIRLVYTDSSGVRPAPGELRLDDLMSRSVVEGIEIFGAIGFDAAALAIRDGNYKAATHFVRKSGRVGSASVAQVDRLAALMLVAEGRADDANEILSAGHRDNEGEASWYELANAEVTAFTGEDSGIRMLDALRFTSNDSVAATAALSLASVLCRQEESAVRACVNIIESGREQQPDPQSRSPEASRTLFDFLTAQEKIAALKMLAAGYDQLSHHQLGDRARRQIEELSTPGDQERLRAIRLENQMLRGNATEALEEIEDHLLKESNDDLLVLKARALRKSGRGDEAIKLLDEILARSTASAATRRIVTFLEEWRHKH
jgi:hypothetical protein